MGHFTRISATALLCMAAVSATAQTPTNPAGPAPGQPTMQGHAMPDQSRGAETRAGKQPPPSASTKAFKDAASQMHMDMAVRYTGDADYDFAAAMTAHHKGAVEMAKVELQYGKDPEMKKLAQEIIAAQEKEIALMRAWQARHK